MQSGRPKLCSILVLYVSQLRSPPPSQTIPTIFNIQLALHVLIILSEIFNLVSSMQKTNIKLIA